MQKNETRNPAVEIDSDQDDCIMVSAPIEKVCRIFCTLFMKPVFTFTLKKNDGFHIPEHFLKDACTGLLYVDPILVSCGHTVSSGFLENYLSELRGRNKCPVCSKVR
jgi:hypothetical protein